MWVSMYSANVTVGLICIYLAIVQQSKVYKGLLLKVTVQFAICKNKTIAQVVLY